MNRRAHPVGTNQEAVLSPTVNKTFVLQKDSQFDVYASVPSSVADATATLAPVYSPNLGQ